MTTQELSRKSGIRVPAIRYALRILRKEGTVIGKFNFGDARQPLYQMREKTVPARGEGLA